MLNFYSLWIKIHEMCTKYHIHIKGIYERVIKMYMYFELIPISIIILSFEITLPLGRLSNDFWMWTSSLNTMHLFSFFVATGVSWEVVSSAPSTSEITIFGLNNLLWCCMCIGIRCIIVHFENFKQNHHGISQLWWNYRVQSWIFKQYWFYLKIYFKDFELNVLLKWILFKTLKRWDESG